MSLTKNKHNWSKDSWKESEPQGESLTKPSQTQSIREILFRNTNGMSYDNYKTPYYEDQAEFSSVSLNTIQNMEPTEKMQFLTELSLQTNRLKSKISDFEKAKQSEIKAEEQAIKDITDATTEKDVE